MPADRLLLPRLQIRRQVVDAVFGDSKGRDHRQPGGAAERDGADYIGVGPVFPTATKPGVKPVGVELVREVAARVKTPFFAIGGISLDNIGEVLEAGATRVAVVSAILKASDKTEAATAFKKRLEKL